jgi:transposase
MGALGRQRRSRTGTDGRDRHRLRSDKRTRGRPHGRISKQGPARHALVEAYWSAARAPGPLCAFYQRVRARRGYQIAIVAAARKLACLFWCMLTRSQDYAYAQPSLKRKKLRRLELTAGAPRYQGKPGIWATNATVRQAERDLAHHAELAYKNTVRDCTATAKAGASATPGHASQGPSRDHVARQTTSP